MWFLTVLITIQAKLDLRVGRVHRGTKGRLAVPGRSNTFRDAVCLVKTRAGVRSPFLPTDDSLLA